MKAIREFRKIVRIKKAKNRTIWSIFTNRLSVFQEKKKQYPYKLFGILNGNVSNRVYRWTKYPVWSFEVFYYNRKNDNYDSNSVAFYNYYIRYTDKNIATNLFCASDIRMDLKHFRFLVIFSQCWCYFLLICNEYDLFRVFHRSRMSWTKKYLHFR